MLIFATNLSAEEFSNEKINLGPNINSIFNDFLPIISPDGKTLYFVRSGTSLNTGGEKDQDIWVSELIDGAWTKAVNIGAPLNTVGSNGVCSVTPDGNTLLLFGVYNSDGSISAGVSWSHRTSDGWSNPEELKITNFYNLSIYSSYYLSNDKKTLLMSVERQDSYGGLDIYVSFLGQNDIWTEPKNLGSQINTAEDDFSPFLAADSRSLYFATNGRDGYGQSDLFKAIRKNETWESWEEPQNLGKEINTPGKDAYFHIPASGDNGYFASSDNGSKNLDIYQILLPEKAKPEAVIFISGKVMNSRTAEPIEASVFYERLPSGEEAGSARSNPTTGIYKITLPGGYLYGFRAEVPGFISVNDNIDARDVSHYQEIERDLELVPIQKGETVRLNNIFFDYDKFELKEESFPELDRIVVMMNENPEMRIKITGHTDSIGGTSYNLNLSKQRAKAVMDYLISKDIAKKRLSYKGYGKSKPIASNDTEEGREQNRRVEFIIEEE
jgi:OOP family OmpA-OmpF porin